MAAGDWPAVRAAAHHLANSASVVRDLPLQEACNALVEAAEAGDIPAARLQWQVCTARLARWLLPDAKST